MDINLINLQQQHSLFFRGTSYYDDASDCESAESITDINQDEEEYYEGSLPTHFMGTYINRPSSGIAQDIHGSSSNEDEVIEVVEEDIEVEEDATSLPPLQINTALDTDTDNNHPPTPWRTSKAKLGIIKELKDPSSDIHLLIGFYTVDDFSQVNFKMIREKYTNNKYKADRFRENMKRLLKNLLTSTGPFAPEIINVNEVVPWYTSVSNVSPAYSLLFGLYMDQLKCRIINAMTDEEVWQSSPHFQQYDLEKFITYNKNMKKLTNKRKSLIQEEEESFRRDMLKLPEKLETSRGLPFWNRHQASDLLHQDVIDGVASRMKPKDLWMSRIEYQDFPLSVFRKHIYQEKTRQLAAPYWQYKRNNNAKKRFEETEEMMKQWHNEQFDKSMEGLVADWEGI